MKEAIKMLVEFSLLYKTLMMVEMRSKIFIAKGGTVQVLTIVDILSMTKAIDSRKLCFTYVFLISISITLEFLCQVNMPKFSENHAHVTWLIITLLFVLSLLSFPVICDGFNDNYTISIISHSGDYRVAYALKGQALHHILL